MDRVIIRRYSTDAVTVTAFCRCGQSSSKPYCDGSHGVVGFKG